MSIDNGWSIVYLGVQTNSFPLSPVLFFCLAGNILFSILTERRGFYFYNFFLHGHEGIKGIGVRRRVRCYEYSSINSRSNYLVLFPKSLSLSIQITNCMN